MRWLLGAAGIALALFGAYRLVTQIPNDDLLALGSWLLGALVLHDGVLAPTAALLGRVVTRVVAPRARRYLAGALMAGAAIIPVAVPMIHRAGHAPPEKALLRQDYGSNLMILLGGIAGLTLLLYGVRVLRDQRANSAKVRPPRVQPEEGDRPAASA